jgi:hypothetical protein
MIFLPDFLKMQIHYPDFLEYLHLPNDYCRAVGCLNLLQPSSSSLSIFLKWAQLFSYASSVMKRLNDPKVINKRHSLEVSAVSRHIVKLKCQFSSLPISAEDGPVSVPGYV